MIPAPLTPLHMPAIAAIETEQLPNPINLRELNELSLRPGFRGFVILPSVDGDPLGHALVLAGGGAADLVSVAVAPAALRRGAATRLLLYVFDTLASEGVEEICLEVAIDNAPARALYDRLDFVEVGRRPGYYRRERELIDALVMRRVL